MTREIKFNIGDFVYHVTLKEITKHVIDTISMGEDGKIHYRIGHGYTTFENGDIDKNIFVNLEDAENGQILMIEKDNENEMVSCYAQIEYYKDRIKKLKLKLLPPTTTPDVQN